MVAVALNVTDVPWQILLAEAEMDMLTGSEVFDCIVIELEATGLLPLIHVALDVTMQVTTSPD